MKPSLASSVISMLAAASLSGAETPEGLSDSDWSGIRAAYEAGRHAMVEQADGTFVARNPGQQWKTTFDGRGFTVKPDLGGWQWGLELTGFGEVTDVRHERGKLSYLWGGGLTEWFVNDARGLEQGWTLEKRPDRVNPGEPLRLHLRVRGGLDPQVAEGGGSIGFVNGSGAAVLTYGGLKAWDADGNIVQAHFVDGEPGSSGFKVEVDDGDASYPITIDPLAQQAYLKASNTEAYDSFGCSVAVSGDTVVVGAYREDSNATGIDGNQGDNSAIDSGAAYVFIRSGGIWTQQAYLKASNTGASDYFGYSVAVSDDTVVVGAYGEDSAATGVDGDQGDNSASTSGAAYVFSRSAGSWTQQAYLKASNTGASDYFGYSVVVSGDTAVVGAYGEDSNATGVDGNQGDDSAGGAGAAYVFIRSGSSWTQQAYLKASNTGAYDFFGSSVAVSGDTVVVGADREASNATGVDGDQGDDSARDSGAAYVFGRSGGIWTQQAYLKASNTGAGDYFGHSVAVSGDTAVVGALGEASNATGVDGNQGDDSASYSGAAYVFSRNEGIWTQQAYLKASNTEARDHFGTSVAVSGDTVVVGAHYEDSAATGVGGNQMDETGTYSGAAYVFGRSGGIWTQKTYLKASNTGIWDNFGWSVAVSDDTVVVGADGEASNATGIDGDQGDDSLSSSGAAYVFAIVPAPVIVVIGPQSELPLVNAQSIAFESMPAGSTAVSKSFTIRNKGEEPLTGLLVSKDGTASGDFQIDTAGMATALAPGASTTFSLDFEPIVIGDRTAAIHIASNDPNESPFDVTLTWQVLPPNDTFAGRINLGSVAASTVAGSVALATSQPADGEPDLSEAAGMGWIDDLTVWYEWTAPAGVEWAKIHLSGPNLPTVLSVYTGTDLPTLSQVALNRREIVSLPNRLTFPVTPGTTYQIRAAVEGFDLLPYLYGFPPPPEPAELDFTLALSTIGTPVTVEDYLMRGRGGLQLGTGAAMAQAEADFSSVLALDPDHDEARFLRALTRLMLIEFAPATDTLLADLDVTRNGTLRAGGEATIPTDEEGNWIPAVGSHSGMLFDWVDSEFLARLTALRAEFDLIQDDDFRTDLTQRETGEPEAYVDKGDVLVFKAVTHGVEMFFHLLFTYDLDVPFESIYNLKVLGSLSAQETLATFTSLLKFAASDRRPQFAAAMRAMEQDYLAATEFIRNRRGDPTDLVTGGLDPDSPEEVELRDNLATAVMSLDGEVNFNGTQVNLSRLMATSVSARDWLPDLRGDGVVPGTLPDPTLDGILPGMKGGEFDSGIYQMGRMWGMAQYAEELGDWLQRMTHQGDPGEDPDNDGRDNFAEWLAYTDALTSDTVWQELTHDVIAPGQKEVRFSFARRKDLRDWKLRVAVSDDMATWDRTESQIEMVGTPVDNGDGFTETVTYRLKDASALAARKFLKVEVVPK